MTNNRMETENDNFARKEDKNTGLDDILNQEISLNTDVMDFFVITGWDYSPCLFKGEYKDKELRQDIRNYVQKRQTRLGKKMKIREQRFINSLFEPYYRKKLKTLSDLKKIIEEKGLIYRGMGLIGIMEFNKTLKKYGFEPLKVGGRYLGAKTLKKYGLEKVDAFKKSQF